MCEKKERVAIVPGSFDPITIGHVNIAKRAAELYDKVYLAVMSRGAENCENAVAESFMEIKYLVRKGKKLPPYNADWFKTYIYTNVGKLSEISNKNMFLLGFADVLFAMFYSCLEEALFEKIKEYSTDSFDDAVEL